MFTNSLHAQLVHPNNVNNNIRVPQLSDSARISLLTCSSGDMLYSVFGHSAIRVLDDSIGVDIVFNYGTFDFDTPFFTLKFMNGDLDYMLASTSFERFIRSYTYEKRSVYEGVIDLTKEEKQNLWDYLVWNIQPNNRAYRYDFFFDNCATKIRDLLFKTKGEYVNKRNTATYSNSSFRDYIHSHLPETTWTAQGIDLLLGVKTDKKVSDFDRAYLPIYLDSLLIDSKIITSQKCILEGNCITYATDDNWFSPDFFGYLLIIIAIGITLYELVNHCYIKWFDISLFSVCGLLSILFWYLWLFTKHDVCSWNGNVLWASIFYWPLIIFIARNRILSNIVTWCVVLNVTLLIGLIMLTICNIQDTATMSIEISCALFIRNISILLKK